MIIEHVPGIREAFAELRRGYPELPLKQQSSGEPFREAAEVVIRAIVRDTIRTIRHSDLRKAVVVLPWRAGLAFAAAYRAAGITRFYHISSRRDETTLETIVDHEEGPAPEGAVIIADPMLATGNTAVDAIRRIMGRGVKDCDIIVNAVVAAPVGIGKIRDAAREAAVIVGALDEKLDERGYIVPGLGDFGDKYFTGLSPGILRIFLESMGLTGAGERRLAARFGL